MSGRSPNDRSGITLIELLLAVSVIGVLMALIVPSVLRIRESGRRLECQTRLRQMGQAIHAYESARQHLPAIARSVQGRRNESRDKGSAHLELLPWLDQYRLAEQMERHRPFGLPCDASGIADPILRRLAQTPLSIFRCPSDGGSGLNNFVFCLGSDAVATMDKQSGYWGRGPFSLIAAMPTSEIHDGLSNTAAVSERLTGSGDATHFDPDRDYWYSGLENLFDGNAVLSNLELTLLCDDAEPTRAQTNVHFGWTWAFGRYDTTCYNHVVAPNSPHNNCSTRSASEVFRGSVHGVFQANSQHPGGVNQLLLDGSVRFLSDNIDLSVYRAIATRSGAEPISVSDF